MGIKNILTVTGDYVGKGFAGQGEPVFDFDSVTSLAMQRMLTERMEESGDPEGFFPVAQYLLLNIPKENVASSMSSSGEN